MPTGRSSRSITMSRNAITSALRPRSLLALLALGGLAACTADTPTAPAEAVGLADQASGRADRVSLCHRSGSGGVIVEVPPGAVAARERQGDYLTALAVSHTSSKPDDDTHFHRIGDALAAARAGRLARGEGRSAACRITITVGPGVFHGTGVPTGKRFLELYPLMVEAGFPGTRVSPRMVYVDSSRPMLVEGFTKNTFTAMIEGVRQPAIDAKLMSAADFDRVTQDGCRIELDVALAP